MIANPFFETTMTNTPADMIPRRNQLALMIMRVVSIVFFISGIGIFFSIPEAPDLKYYLLALGLNLDAALIFFLTSDAVRGLRNKVIRFLILAQLAIIAIGLLVSGTTVVAALISLIFSILVSSVILDGSESETGVSVGIFSAFLILLGNIFISNFQIVIPLFPIVLPPLVGVLVISYMVMVTLGVVSVPLRIKLITASLFMVIAPLILLALVSTIFTQNSISEQRNQNLMLAAERTASAIDTFINTNRQAVEEDSRIPLFVNFLALPEKSRDELRYGLELTFSALNQRNSEFIKSFGLLDQTGTNIFDTDVSEINHVEGFSDYFIEAFARQVSYVSEIRFPENEKKAYFYISSPIIDQESNSLGVLRVKISADVIQSILENNLNLAGSETKPLLIDENQVRIGDTYNYTFNFKSLSGLNATQLMTLKSTGRLPNLPDALLSTSMTQLSEQLIKSAKPRLFSALMTPIYGDNKNEEIIATAFVQSKPWTVLYTQRAEVLQSLIKEQTSLSWLITTIIAFLTTIIATVVARTISHPVIRLTTTANEIVRGNLEAKAEVTTTDEVGDLANIFNAMTSQLRTSINDLEDRVAARTKELDEQNKSLAYRSRQVETISEVARNITSTQDLAKLLTLITELVSQRFGFYHAGVFLIDEKKEYAVLRAANSDGGKRMLARQHKLKVGQVGIVGYVTGNGEARIATDVGEDSTFFNNPDLPLTRSEMALPLKTGTQVIGALDIQSEKPDAFNQEDIELFTTLADQIAVGIMNSRLLDETQRALDESQAIHRQYLKQEWVRQTSQQEYIGYLHTSSGLIPISDHVEPELETVFQSGKTSTSVSQENQPGKSTLSVPVTLKGQVIGAIQLQDSERGGREWSETELAAAQAVADQIAQALENARLFELTARRAERERKVLEITSKIRATNDPQEMMEIAMEEVKQALGASHVQVVFNEITDHGNGNNGHHPERKAEQRLP